MLQIPPEFILKTLENAYKKYDDYNTIGDEIKKAKIYGFCDGLERLIYKFAPQYSDEIASMKAKSAILDAKNSSGDINLDEPTILRRMNQK